MFRQLISESVGIVNGEWPWVLLAAAIAFFFAGLYYPLNFVLVLVSGFAAQVVLFGRIASRVKGETRPGVVSLLKDHAINYFVVLVVLSVIELVLGLAALGLVSDQGKAMSIAAVLGIILDVAFLFVLPLVFLRKFHIDALFPGFSLLRDRFGDVWELAVLSGAIGLVVVYLPGLLLSENAELATRMSVWLPIGLLGMYAYAIVFSSASLFVLRKTDR